MFDYQQIKELINPDAAVEQCGYFNLDGQAIALPNLSPTPERSFIADVPPGEAIAVWHTHLEQYGAELSFADINNSNHLRLPYLLYHPDRDMWDYYEPDGIHPFPMQNPTIPENIEHWLGWRWVYGRSDCYSLMRNWFRFHRNIELPMIDRSECGEWEQPGWNRFEEGLIAAGFQRSHDSLKYSDVVMMRFKGCAAHHCAIFLSGDRILHTIAPPRVSEIANIRTFKDYVVGYWRI